MSKPTAYVAGDYAGVKTSHGRFYYGYEVVYCPECDAVHKRSSCKVHDDADTQWCFTADIPGKERIAVPYSKLGAEDRFNTAEVLLLGMAWVIEKYGIGDTP